MDIRSFFGGGGVSKGKPSTIKQTESNKKTPIKKSTSKLLKTPTEKKKSSKTESKKSSTSEKEETIKIDSDSDFDEKEIKKKTNLTKSRNLIADGKSKNKDKNGNIHVSKSCDLFVEEETPKKPSVDVKRRKAAIESSSDSEPKIVHRKTKEVFAEIESSDEDVIQVKQKRKKGKKKVVIFDSDSDAEEPIPKKKPRQKKRIHLSSDDEVHQTSISEAFQAAKSHAKPKPKTTPVLKSPSPQKKQISVADFFGMSTVQRVERKTITPTSKRKADSSPNEVVDEDAVLLHDDDDFEETLRQLDDKPKNKKAKLEAEDSKLESLASKLAKKSKDPFRVQETPEKPVLTQQKTVKLTKEESPVKTIKPSPLKKTPVQVTPEKKLSTENAPGKKSNASFRSFLTREGPRALGSKEVPEAGDNCLEGLTFIITGVLDSFERDEMKSIIEKYGGKVTGSLSKKTSYMLVGRDAGEAKLSKATSFGTKILDEDGILNLLKTLPGKKSKYEISAEKECKATPGKKTASTSKFESPAVTKPSTPNTPKPSASNSLPSPPVTPSTPKTSPDDDDVSLLWVDKYKPTNIKQIIGQNGDKSNAKKLLSWLLSWHKNVASGRKPAFNKFNDDGGGYRAALLSGPPGIGKTTTAHLVCKEAGFDFVELNASDTRSKKSLQEEVAESLNNHSLSGYFGNGGKNADGKWHCLVMDEVDGMAGNEDRGGIQELVGLIKNTKIPIICMCNDRNHPKMRTLSNYCFDLRFQRPRVEQIKSAMMSLVFKEGVKIPPPALNEIIMASNQDVRQVIHNLSMWSVNEKNLSYDKLKVDADKAKKDLKIGPFDVVRKVFSTGEETAHMTINDKADLFFHDYSFGPLFVQENYITVQPMAARGDTKKHLQCLSQAADSIAFGDIVSQRIRGQQQWSMLPVQAIFSSVIPGEAMRGYMGGQIQFPSWLGKNSSQGKNDRILQELKSHMRLKISGDKRGVNMDYVPHLRLGLTTPLVSQGSEGVSDVIKVLDEYDLIKEDMDNILEVSQWPNSKDAMAGVESMTKAAFTRAYNKEVHMTPYATGTVAKKRRAGSGADLDNDLEGEGEGGGTHVQSEEEEEEDVSVDTMIKKKAAPKPRGKSVEAKGPAKGKGKGRGKGKS